MNFEFYVLMLELEMIINLNSVSRLTLNCVNLIFSAIQTKIRIKDEIELVFNSHHTDGTVFRKLELLIKLPIILNS